MCSEGWGQARTPGRSLTTLPCTIALGGFLLQEGESSSVFLHQACLLDGVLFFGEW